MRPNILFINTDQHHHNALSAKGNKYVKTPNIDRLVKNGMSFEKTYCTDPVCAPSRSSWICGLYTSETGVPLNGGRMHEGIPDLGQILTSNGYYAAHCGKWHVDGRDVRDSFHCLYYGNDTIAAGGAEYYDTTSTHAAIDFLSNYDKENPFFLEIGYINPHDICEYLHDYEFKNIPALEKFNLIDEAALPPFPTNFDYDTNETTIHRVCCRENQMIHNDIRQATDKWTQYQWQYYIFNYYRYIEKADIEIGKVLNFLEKTGFVDNTIIIFTSDHGEACGAHKMFQKFTLYEESIRVSFVIASLSDKMDIAKKHIDNTHFISGVDILPTVLDYAQIDIPSNIHGTSIKPLAENKTIPWRDFAYVESNVWGRAIITNRYKLVTEYLPNEDSLMLPPNSQRNKYGKSQLFDLETDAGETKNLIDDGEYKDIVKSLFAKLKDHEESLEQPMFPSSVKSFIDESADRMIEFLMR